MNFENAERLVISPKKILIIGTMGSGKTTVAQHLARDAGFMFVSIDACRIRYGDGTVSGEDSAWDHFLALCQKPSPAILEFSGCGPHVDEVRDALLRSRIPVTVIWLVLPLGACTIRAMQRKKNIPAPYLWAPIIDAVPAIHDAVEYSWERTWSREPSFQALRQEFSGTTSIARMYSAVIRKICSSPQ
jgi:hypothetical protein